MSVIKNVFLKLNEKTKDIVLCTLSNFYIRGLAGRIPTNELVNRIYVFCELYSGKSLFPYQTQFSRRVIRSVIENDGDEITALFSRQSGKTETISVTSGGLMIILPLLANMPMFANDNRLSMFVDGFWIGIFAPNQRQAGITFNRIRSQLLSKSSIAILESPEFNLTFTTSNGTNVALSNGSHVMAISASEGSNIEGESCMLIICEECLIAGTPILSDKGYIPVEDIIVGDIVISYNHATNKLEPQKVCKTWSKSIVNRKLVKVYTKSGKLVCTDNHRVYVKDRGYIRADSLQIGDVVLSYSEYRDIIEKVEIIPVEECVVYDICVDKNHNFFAGDILVHNCQDISNFKIQKSIMPMGAAYNASIVKIGTSTNFKGDFYDTIQRNKVYDLKCNSYTRRHFEFDCDVASKYNPKYAKYVEKQKQSLGEKSDAFRMAYKLEWIFERGMFVDILDFELNNVDTSLGFVEYDKDSTYIAGIDLGGKNDSTVVAMIQVNHDFPLVLESRVNEDGEEVWYETFNTYLMGFLELKNMPNFEEQYPIILDYLYKFNVLRVVCDATRESAVSHRLAANLPYEVIPYVMTPKSKSDVYKNFETEIVTRRFSVAGDNSTKQTSEYKDFIGQLGELQKGWNGTNMVVSHPTERNAHDDFPDAVALGVWGAMTRAIPNTAETGNNVFFNQRTKNEIKSLVGRNKLTAKRRM